MPNRLLPLLVLGLVSLLATPPAAVDAQGIDYADLPPIEDDVPVVGEKPDEVVGLDLVDRRGQSIPRNLEFTRPDGQVITTGQLLGDVPVLLCLNYSRCPMLCGRQQQLLAEGLKDLTLRPGEDYRFVSVSIDPLESPATAGETRQNFLRKMQAPLNAQGVDFLVGKRPAIDALAQAVGFDYQYVPERRQYAHNARMFVLSPDGLITRSLNGFYGSGPEQFSQQTLRLSIVEASDGQVSSLFDNIVLQCFKYDAMTGKYTPVAWKIMRTGAALTVLILALVLVPVWWKASRNRTTAPTDDAPTDDATADNAIADNATTADRDADLV